MTVYEYDGLFVYNSMNERVSHCLLSLPFKTLSASSLLLSSSTWKAGVLRPFSKDIFDKSDMTEEFLLSCLNHNTYTHTQCTQTPRDKDTQIHRIPGLSSFTEITCWKRDPVLFRRDTWKKEMSLEIQRERWHGRRKREKASMISGDLT